MGLLTEITTKDLYEIGIKRKFLNLRHFWKWILFAAVHGAFAYFMPFFLLSGPIDSNGRTL